MSPASRRVPNSATVSSYACLKFCTSSTLSVDSLKRLPPHYSGACKGVRGVGSAKAKATASQESLTIRRMTHDAILALADFLAWAPRGRRHFFGSDPNRNYNKRQKLAVGTFFFGSR